MPKQMPGLRCARDFCITFFLLSTEEHRIKLFFLLLHGASCGLAASHSETNEWPGGSGDVARLCSDLKRKVIFVSNLFLHRVITILVLKCASHLRLLKKKTAASLLAELALAFLCP